MLTAHSAPCRNSLLMHLAADEYAQLSPLLESIELPCKYTVAARNEPVTHVYFPCNCVLSVLALMENGSAIEVGTIGKEGFFGIDLLIGAPAALEHTVCQVGGTCLRMTAADFRREVGGDTPLRRIAHRYLQAYLRLVSQSVACNRLHTLEERFARWVLMTRDRVDTDDLRLTQEFLAQMLGVRRPSVSLVASAFQQAGSIRYNRGEMTVLDRRHLENAACECYAIVAQQFERLLG